MSTDEPNFGKNVKGIGDDLGKYVRRVAVNLGVEIVKLVPGFGRGVLERLLEEDPAAFAEIVPQGIDMQTRLYAKQHFEETLLPRILLEAEQEGIPASYALIDVDGLKEINDSGGHGAGDAAIAYISDLVRTSFRTRKITLLDRIESFFGYGTESYRKRKYPRARDLVARLDGGEAFSGRVGHGDEFAVILCGCTQEQAIKVMERFLRKVREGKARYGENEISVTVSVGVAQYEPGLNPRELIKRADISLYGAKDAGKNTVAGYSPELAAQPK